MSDNKIIQFPNKMVDKPEFKITDTAIKFTYRYQGCDI